MSAPSHDDLLDPNLALPSQTSSIYTNFTDSSLHDISPSSEDPAVNPSSSQPSTISADLSFSTSKSAPHPCKVCGVNAFFLCRACGFDGPRYCSEKCQEEDWRGEHHSKCKAKKKSNTDEHMDDSREGGSSEGKSTGHKGLTRGNIAQIINAKRRRNNSREGTSTGAGEQSAEASSSTAVSEELSDKQAEEFRFYIQQVYRILKPVVLCICLSVLWIKISYQMPGSSQQGSVTYFSSGGSSSSKDILDSFVTAAIIISQVIVATFALVCLFKYGHMKILKGILVITVILLLGFMGYLLFENILQAFSVPLDYVTFIFALWNFSVVGLISVFWKGPLLLQKIYLVVMSSLTAFSLSQLSAWTTWILLGLLAIWDLIAVLCPFGPLRILVESAKEEKRGLPPALLYTVNAIWLMASPDLSITVRRTSSTPDHFQASPPLSSASTFHMRQLSTETGEHIPLSENPRHSNNSMINDDTIVQSDTVITENTGNNNEAGSGLKLGLGDFVFYSVLVARAAMFDWITTISCAVAILTGLNATIFLLAIYQKALPALPISIALGLIFFFLSSIMLVPYTTTLGLAQVFV
ncbi:11617_t:CDS:10 [Paraglomus brasilianum]|uniref:Presenilin n=1 Tax=Paraglomus brasilianum TaxID=144538 RepID=A0A9N8ZE82_9GLOM|nr:11617_t:CDS:10 [Paraglomus brasilianum]